MRSTWTNLRISERPWSRQSEQRLVKLLSIQVVASSILYYQTSKTASKQLQSRNGFVALFILSQRFRTHLFRPLCMAHSASPRSPSRSPRRNGDLRLESEGDPAPPSSQLSVHTSATNSSPVLGAARSLPSEPPRAPRRMRNYMPHDDRPVTPPPVQTPTPDYIELASQAPSQLCGEPSSSRKLLILDLNGTLLHRAAPHGPRKDKRTNQGKPLPRLRPVHARPYMPSFRNFLFAPQTKKWLDAMIWSSAQPYSVEDMVDKTFGKSKSALVAIWARDTLGLTNEQYSMYSPSISHSVITYPRLHKTERFKHSKTYPSRGLSCHLFPHSDTPNVPVPRHRLPRHLLDHPGHHHPHLRCDPHLLDRCQGQRHRKVTRL